MDDGLKFFKKYFKYLKTHSTKCDQLIDEAVGPLTNLSNRVHVLKHISRSNPGNEIHSLFPDLRVKLEGEIYSNLDENLKVIWDIEYDIDNSTKELKMHLHEVEVLPRPTSFNFYRLNGLTVLHPSFDDLQAMASDAWRYYHDLWMNIHAALLIFNHKDKSSLKTLKNAFEEDKDAKKDLKYILARTTFLIEE
ncbi:uncharacterized protein LOC111047309 [Nilaparvata lugens]|uniref:uncharacterized protein LOC111047309 n=1 Tax=Nilaparvata lugens TaxID=108931 RepID=UPI00193E3EDB|nr:uncharacterized protein LOC111047309 [Nilaparvata lugens]